MHASLNAGISAEPGDVSSTLSVRDSRQGLASRYNEEYGNELNGEEDPFSDGFDRELARQFSGELGLHGFDGSLDEGFDDGFDDEEHPTRPLSLRSLQWLRRNMSSLRIIVSLQRVTPPDPYDDRPRKASG
jgi:hypothetical protein